MYILLDLIDLIDMDYIYIYSSKKKKEKKRTCYCSIKFGGKTSNFSIIPCHLRTAMVLVLEMVSYVNEAL